MRRALFAVVLASGCTAEIPSYEHVPTKNLHADVAEQTGELAPFTHDGVTVRAEMIQGYADVKLRFAAKEAHEILVERVEVEGASGDPLVLEGPRRATLKPNKALPIHYGATTLTKPGVDAASIDAHGREGFWVTVTWSVDEGDATATELVLERSVETKILWPT